MARHILPRAAWERTITDTADGPMCEVITLTEQQRKDYIELVAKQGILQARATLRARYSMNNAAWWRKNRTAIIAEWDRLDGEERK